MVKLVVYRGDEDFHIRPVDGDTYVYQIGAGKILGGSFISLNNFTKLNDIAVSLRDSYTEWIYSLNEVFISKDLVWDEQSLFFLTDLSNKRNELFDTYESLSNLILIRQQLLGLKIDLIELVGLDKAFEQSIRSIYPNARLRITQPRSQRIRLSRRIFADLKYLLELVIVVVINKCVLREKPIGDKESTKYFFSFFPQTFDKNYRDKRYGNLVESEDKYLVTMVADGMHQQVSPGRYLKLARVLPTSKFVLIDKRLAVSDILRGVKWLLRCHRFLIRDRKRSYYFQELDVSRYIRQEIVWSSSRISRLMLILGPIKRIVGTLNIRELVYLNFEYAFGRMISLVLGRYYPEVLRTGFNHGDFSWRFINYFLAPGEASVQPPYLDNCPIPDRVLAEDKLCAEIYQFNGYKNVEIMPKVYRLAYLDKIKPTRQSGYALIAGALHDGPSLLACLLQEIKDNPEIVFLFKPHPRSRIQVFEEIQNISNLKVVHNPIEELFEYVGRIYVTYSGVGVEGWRLGIPVTLVEMPGRISWSKLLDYDQFK